MPVIPRYERQRTIPSEGPNVRTDVSSAGMVGRAVSQFGESIGQFGNQIADVIAKRKEQLRKQDLVNSALTISAAYDEDHRAFEQSEYQLTGQDSYDNLDRAKKFREDSMKKFLDGVNDPELKTTIQKHIYSQHNQLADKLSTHQVKQRSEVTKQAIENTLAGTLKDAYAGADLNDILKRYSVAVLAQRTAGSIGEVQAEDLIVKGANQIAEAHLDGIISRSPATAVELIKKGVYHQHLPQKKIEEYDKKAKELGKADNVTNYFNALSVDNTKSDGTLDYEKIFKIVQNPNNYSKYGITAEQAGQVANLFNSQRVHEKQFKDEQLDKTADDMWQRIQNKKERPATLINEIQKAVINQTMKREVADNFIKELSDPAVKTNAATYLRIKEHILENKTDITGNKKLIYGNLGNLTASDAGSLLTTAFSEIDDVEGKIRKRNMDFIKSQLAPSKGLLAAGSPGEDDNLKKALDNFDVLVENAKKAGKPLDQKTMDELSRQVVTSHAPTIEQRMKWQKESILGTKSESAFGVTKPKKTKGDLWKEVSSQGSSSAGKKYLMDTYGYSEQQAIEIIREGLKEGEIR